MNNSNFLETENFKYLIKFVFNDVKQKTNYDISNNKKYIGIFKKLVQTVHVKNNNQDNEFSTYLDYPLVNA